MYGSCRWSLGTLTLPSGSWHLDTHSKQTTGEKQEVIAKFRQQHLFLEEQEKLLLALIEEVENEIETTRDQSLAELSEALLSVDSLIQEMEKCQQLASDLLQDARSTLKRYEEKEAFENPVTFPLALKWRISEYGIKNLFLEGIMNQIRDTLVSGLCLQIGIYIDQ
uniref:Uncharacterized protein n=1 Tax=Sphaerodactylus townsendi TaxID=933632 RepID=A0ACB8EFP6_9SAUR